MSLNRLVAKNVFAGCVLFGAAHAAAAVRCAFPLPDVGPLVTEHTLADRALVYALHRFAVMHVEDERYAALVKAVNLFMSLVAEALCAGTGVGFQLRSTRVADEAIRIATCMRSGVDVDVEDLECLLGDHLHNLMIM